MQQEQHAAWDTPGFVDKLDLWLQQQWLVVMAVAILTVVALGLVVMAGGPPTAFAHFMYAAIVLAAMRFGPLTGLITGLAGGMVVGPLAGWLVIGAGMLTAEYVAEGLIRALWFGGIGVILGLAFAYARHQQRELGVHLHTDASTALPNLKAAEAHIATMRKHADLDDKDILVKALRVLNYQDLVNNFGHEKADKVMQTLAKRMRKTLPQGTFIGRTGPGTFSIIDWINHDESADKHSERLSALARDMLPAGEYRVYVDTAIGAVRSKAAEADPKAMFARAVVAATQADEHNAPYRLYDPAEDERRLRRIRLLGEVDRAMADGEMALHYQPKLHLGSRGFRGFEALARWQHPEHGMIPPGEFIPMVERTEAIHGFTRWALEQAIAQVADWREKGHDVSVAVNVSTRNLPDADIWRHVSDLLARYRVAPAGLELEITESALVDLSSARIDMLHELRERGVKIAIDDFGTGYASLAYLRELPVDILKLDRSFLRAVPGNKDDNLMVKRIIQMAKDRGLEVVAEGIEDAGTLRMLKQLGCDYAQGYYIAKPMPAERIEDILNKGWGGRIDKDRADGQSG